MSAYENLQLKSPIGHQIHNIADVHYDANTVCLNSGVLENYGLEIFVVETDKPGRFTDKKRIKRNTTVS